MVADDSSPVEHPQAAPALGRSRAGGPLRSFAIPGYRLVWAGGSLFQMARWMETTVMGWLVLEMTGSAFMLALVGFYRMAPMVVLGPLSGLFADRVSRKLLLVIAAGVSALATAALAAFIVLDAATLPVITVAMLALGLGWALDFPAHRALIRDLAGAQGVVNAMALENVGFNLSRIAGPALGGLLLEVGGAKLAYPAVAGVFLLSLVPFALIRAPSFVRGRSQGVLRDLGEGLRYATKERVILGVLGITVAMNLLFFPFNQLLPVFARDVLHVGPGLLGLMGAASGFGAMIGAVGLAFLPDLRRPGIAFIVGCFIAGGGLLAFAASEWYGLSIGLLVGLSVGQALFGILQSTIVLTTASDEMRGRALGMVGLAIGAMPPGILLLGAMTRALGAQLAAGIAAVSVLLLVSAITLAVPQLRKGRV